MQDALLATETRECEVTATDVFENNPVDVSSLSSKRGNSLCAVQTRSLRSIEQSLNHPQPTSPRHRDGPPKSSEINATIIPQTRRVPNDDIERHTGCLNFLRRGRRCREGSAYAMEAGAGSSPEGSAMRHTCSACSEDTREQAKASLMEGAEPEVSGRTFAQGYHHGRVEDSGPPHEPAKQESVNCLAVNTASRNWQSIERADMAMNPASRGFDDSSPRSPYDMRHGAVQPQYFCTGEALMYRQIAQNDLQRQNSIQRRTTTSSIPSEIRSATTLSTSPSIRRKPLIDLTPQYQPPPQHRHKGHGYYPEQLGSGKLVDYATSLKK